METLIFAVKLLGVIVLILVLLLVIFFLLVAISAVIDSIRKL